MNGWNFAPTPPLAGGVRVATGDVNGDGVLDVVTAAGFGPAIVRLWPR